MKDSLAGRPIDDVATIVKELSLMSFFIFDELIEKNEFALAEAATSSDAIIVFQCPELDFFHYVKIENGKYYHLLGTPESVENKKSDLNIILTKEAMVYATRGDSTYTKEVVKGRVKMKGDLRKGVILNGLFEIVKNSLDFELNLM